MKRLLWILALSLAPLFALAQQARDVIYLNNGNTVAGTIVSSDNLSVTVRTASGEALTYRRGEIRKIDGGEELERMPQAPRSHYRDYTEAKKGFWAAVELGGGVSVDHDSSVDTTGPVDLTFTFGYRFSEFLQVGVGAGFRYYIENANARVYCSGGKYEDYGWAFPVYGNLRGVFISGQSRRVVPYWSVSVGHTFNDGFMASPTLGLRFGAQERHHFLLGLGYTAQQTRLHDLVEGGVSRRFGCLHLLQLKLGYQF